MELPEHTIPYLSQFDVDVPLNPNPLADIFPLNISFRDGLVEKHIKYVMLHRKLGEKLYDRTYQFLMDNLGAPFYQNPAEDTIAWRVEQILQKPDVGLHFRLDYGWNAGLFQNQGQPERLVEQDGHLLIYAPTAQSQTLSFKARAILKPQSLQVKINGQTLITSRFNQPETFQTMSVPLNLHAGENILELQALEACSTPNQYDPNNTDVRCLSFGVQDVRLNTP